MDNMPIEFHGGPRDGNSEDAGIAFSTSDGVYPETLTVPDGITSRAESGKPVWRNAVYRKREGNHYDFSHWTEGELEPVEVEWKGE